VYAGFLRRFAAYFLDAIIVSVLGASVAIPLTSPELVSGADPAELMRLALRSQVPRTLVMLVIAMLYYTLQESSSAQATLGKRAMGIKVTDLQGARISFGHALGRWFAAALSYLTLYIGFLMAAFTGRKQALHDLVASTLVVDRWAYSEHPERQKRDLSGCGLALLLVVLLMLALAVVAVAFAVNQFGAS
jgi:uncharacterized RDD family membrane protein YckC